ncbi:hypothetical protein BHM03_00063073, partial [Ensete ventricosum]
MGLPSGTWTGRPKGRALELSRGVGMGLSARSSDGARGGQRHEHAYSTLIHAWSHGGDATGRRSYSLVWRESEDGYHNCPGQRLWVRDEVDLLTHGDRRW